MGQIRVLATKALGVSVDELLGCQPPLRRFDRSDWQNLMSYAFALGGGVVFYLLNLFMPAVLCYLLYLLHGGLGLLSRIIPLPGYLGGELILVANFC